MSETAKWYVVHTYSGYENKVKVDLEKTIENHGIKDQILDIQIPMQEVTEVKDNVKKTVMKKTFPGYLLIKMFMSDHNWYIVKNTRGVTGFVGLGSKPVPLTEQEVLRMGVEDKVVFSGAEDCPFNVGDKVRVKNGPLENFIGVVEEVRPEQQRLKAVVSMFGRDTLTDLEFFQVEPVN